MLSHARTHQKDATEHVYKKRIQDFLTLFLDSNDLHKYLYLIQKIHKNIFILCKKNTQN